MFCVTLGRPPQVGDYVDVKANASIQKGMPFKGYHGRTGVVFNVTKRALGVSVNKLVGRQADHSLASSLAHTGLPLPWPHSSFDNSDKLDAILTDVAWTLSTHLKYPSFASRG